MKKNYDKGYQLPASLIEVMDLASELNAKACQLGLNEQNRLVAEEWFSTAEIRDVIKDLLLALDHTDLVMQCLSDYAAMLIKTEITEKNK